jgi:hypothetical protein
MRGGDLLLLLLEYLDLLCNGKLFHHQRRQLRGAAAVRNVQAATSRTHWPLLLRLLLLLLLLLLLIHG